MDEKTQAEYDRIKAGPHDGWFTFIHHQGPIIDLSADIMERLDYILDDKPEKEHYDRLRHIYHVEIAELPLDWQEAEKVNQKAYIIFGKAYMSWQMASKVSLDVWETGENLKYGQEIQDLYNEAYMDKEETYKIWQEAKTISYEKLMPYLKILIPNCAWNGKTILGGKENDEG